VSRRGGGLKPKKNQTRRCAHAPFEEEKVGCPLSGRSSLGRHRLHHSERLNLRTNLNKEGIERTANAYRLEKWRRSERIGVVKGGFQ